MQRGCLTSDDKMPPFRDAGGQYMAGPYNLRRAFSSTECTNCCKERALSSIRQVPRNRKWDKRRVKRYAQILSSTLENHDFNAQRV